MDLILAVQEKIKIWGRNFGGVSVKPNLFRYYKTTHQIELLFKLFLYRTFKGNWIFRNQKVSRIPYITLNEASLI